VAVEDLEMDDDERAWTDPVSPDSLVEQIDKEAASFGLCAEYDPDMGVVFVCETEPKPEARYGLGDCSREAAGRRLMGVDDAHPLAQVFGHRILPGEVKPGERFDRYHETKERTAEQIKAESRKDIVSAMRLRLSGGARFYGGMLDLTQEYRKAKAQRLIDRLRRGG